MTQSLAHPNNLYVQIKCQKFETLVSDLVDDALMRSSLELASLFGYLLIRIVSRRAKPLTGTEPVVVGFRLGLEGQFKGESYSIMGKSTVKIMI